MSCIQTNILAGASGQGGGGGGGGYEIERSLRFNSADDSRLDNSMSTAGNRSKYTFSFWVKFAGYDYAILSCGTNSSGFFEFKFNGDSQLELHGENITGTKTVSVFRDYSAWYHIMLVIDKANSTASDRAIIYVNGTRQTLTTTDQGNTGGIYWGHSAQPHRIGGRTWGVGNEANYYLAEFYHLDNIAATPSAFGETDNNGVWQPIEYDGTYGTIGFHLDFADNSSNAALGTDTSGNGNTWTVNNLSVAAGAGNDSLRDSPTNGTQTDTGAGGEVVGNYATLLNQYVTDKTRLTMANGNLDVTFNNAGSSSSAFSSIGVNSGKWYAEFTVNQAGSNYAFVGIASPKNNNIDSLGYGDSYAYANNTGNKANNGSFVSYGATWTANDVIGVALDLDAGTLTFYKNGSSQGQAYSSISGTYVIGCTGFQNWRFSANFGQRAFAYTAPSGYKALCTASLPEPTIADGSAYFDTKLYTGSGVARSITGYEFSPDWVWLKRRSAASNHLLFDIIRGTEKILESDTSDAEATLSGSLTAFNSDGFSLGTSSGGNNSGATWVAWAWDAGSSTVTNNDGSIASQVRANPSAGFSIVSYIGTGSNGATVGHGLNAAPSMIFVKNRDLGGEWQWVVRHSSIGSPFLMLDDASKQNPNTGVWTSTSPTSSVFSIGTSLSNNANGNDLIAYCFAPVEGYSAFGSYTGNGSADGPFVYTGFRPAFLMFKRSDSTGDWIIFDNKRNTHEGNYREKVLYPNKSNAEETSADGDTMLFLSNGFKLNNVTYAYWNASGGTYIYAAFAEHPFKTARAR